VEEILAIKENPTALRSPLEGANSQNISQEKFTTNGTRVSPFQGGEPTARFFLLESQIDQLVYQLYDLTEEEIRVVEE
jgi:hypothetical protein